MSKIKQNNQTLNKTKIILNVFVGETRLTAACGGLCLGISLTYINGNVFDTFRCLCKSVPRSVLLIEVWGEVRAQQGWVQPVFCGEGSIWLLLGVLSWRQPYEKLCSPLYLHRTLLQVTVFTESADFTLGPCYLWLGSLLVVVQKHSPNSLSGTMSFHSRTYLLILALSASHSPWV